MLQVSFERGREGWYIELIKGFKINKTYLSFLPASFGGQRCHPHENYFDGMEMYVIANYLPISENSTT